MNYIYPTHPNDCTWKENPPLIYMEVTVPGQILSLQSPTPAKMIGDMQHCSCCNAHSNNND